MHNGQMVMACERITARPWDLVGFLPVVTPVRRQIQ